MTARAYRHDREVSLGPIGARSVPSRRVQLVPEIIDGFQRLAAEVVMARECSKMPRDLRTTIDNIGRGQGIKTVATLYAVVCDVMPLAPAEKLGSYWSGVVRANHRTLAPECWTPSSLIEAHEANDAANAELQAAQTRQLYERSESALMQVEACAQVEASSAVRLARQARLEIQRREARG